MSQPELKTINLPTVPQRACQLPGGPLIAILVGLENSLVCTLDAHQIPRSLTAEVEGTTQKIRSAISLAANMYRTPRQSLDPEAYAVEMHEACLAMLLCKDRCTEAFTGAVDLEELEGDAVHYVVQVLAPEQADLGCLDVLSDVDQLTTRAKNPPIGKLRAPAICVPSEWQHVWDYFLTTPGTATAQKIGEKLGIRDYHEVGGALRALSHRKLIRQVDYHHQPIHWEIVKGVYWKMQGDCDD